jgi:glycopeptide antibiotics resistance protein
MIRPGTNEGRRVGWHTESRDATSVFSARRVYAWTAVAVAVFAIYVSLIPFDFRPVPFDRAIVRFERVMLSSHSETTSRSNYLANALLFVPIGFGLSGAALAERRRRWPAMLWMPAIIPMSLALSLTAEFLQIFTRERIVSRDDVVAQMLGCLVGIAAWMIAGDRLTSWLRTASDRQRGDRVARSLSAYAVLWTFINLAPFDLTVDLGTIANRYRRGLISLVPFSNVGAEPWRFLWDALATTLSAVPLGALGLVGWTGLGERRHARAAFVFGASFVVLMEVAQIFIRSHAADITDALFGGLGVAAGVWFARRVLSHREPVAALPPRAMSSQALAILLLWCGVLCAYHWLPYDFAFDPEAIKHKLGRMSLVPFVGYWSGSDLNTFKNVLVKLALSIPFGIIAAFVVHRRIASRSVLAACWIVVAAIVFGAIEAGQLLLASRTPDPTDVLVGVAGCAAGLWIGGWVRT